MIPTIVVAAYRTVVWFVTDVFPHPLAGHDRPRRGPSGRVIYAIMIYAKNHPLLHARVGLALVTMAILIVLHALLFEPKHWVRRR